jgi:3-hydroxypropanoate dehydrogenase
MVGRLPVEALEQIFLKARTLTRWLPRDVPDDLLAELVDILKLGPTSANCSPARFVFVKTKAAKARLKPALSPGNVEKTMSAPVTAIIAYDMEFYERLPQLFPHEDARSWFAGKPAVITSTALRNGSLQGAYLIIAARSLGLDCGPMSGFDNAKVDAEFFPNRAIRSNFLCNLGYGDWTSLHDRSPRLSFADMAQIL